MTVPCRNLIALLSSSAVETNFLSRAGLMCANVEASAIHIPTKCVWATGNSATQHFEHNEI